MRKKLVSVLLICALLVVSLPTVVVKAEEVELTAPSGVLMEAASGKVLFEKASREKRACASITKVMTLLLAMEAIETGSLSLTETLYASARAASMGGSDIWLKEGEAMTVNDLLKATVIMSANDAAVVLAEKIGGSEEAFVARMNEKAQRLGMKDTLFKNCNGLDEEGHLTTAYDVALMSRALIVHPKIFDYTLTWIDYLREGQTQLVNTNKLIKTYKGITGLKTGTTAQAGSCIAATAERDGMKLIGVVLGAPDTKSRFQDSAALLDFGFAKWSLVNLPAEPPEKVKIKGGMEEFVGVSMEGDPQVLTERSAKAQVKWEVFMDEEPTAPIAKGQRLGTIKIFSGKTVLKELPLTAVREVEEITVPKALWHFLQLFSFGSPKEECKEIKNN